MKVKKEAYHPELQKGHGPLKTLNYLLSRHWGIKVFRFFDKLSKGQKLKGYQNEVRYIPSQHGGPDIRVRIIKPLEITENLPILCYLHGGGYIVGSPETSLFVLKRMLETRPCIIVAPDYRKAGDGPFPAGFNDCYDTLLWARDHAEELQGRGDAIMVGGHSAGGGMTAAVTLKARDTQDVKIAFQMPIYPMIDDSQSSASAVRVGTPLWDAKTNAMGWGEYLKGLHGQGAEIPAYAAPIRNTDYRNFPPTMTFVGGMDPFRDETLAYVDALKKAQIPVAFERFDGGFHGFEIVKNKTNIGQAAWTFFLDSYAKYYDKYCVRTSKVAG